MSGNDAVNYAQFNIKDQVLFVSKEEYEKKGGITRKQKSQNGIYKGVPKCGNVVEILELKRTEIHLLRISLESEEVGSYNCMNSL